MATVKKEEKLLAQFESNFAQMVLGDPYQNCVKLDIDLLKNMVTRGHFYPFFPIFFLEKKFSSLLVKNYWPDLKKNTTQIIEMVLG